MVNQNDKKRIDMMASNFQTPTLAFCKIRELFAMRTSTHEKSRNTSIYVCIYICISFDFSLNVYHFSILR